MELEPLPSALSLAIDGLNRSEITSPQMPTDKMLFYAEDVQHLLSDTRPYRAKLIEVGLKASLLDIFDVLVQWAEKTERLWHQHRNEGKSDTLIELEKKGIALREELVAACRFYLRRDISTQQELKAIMYGEGISDLILDLNTLSSLIRSNRRAFSRYGHFDPSLRVEETRDLLQQLRQARWEAEWDESLDALRHRRDELFTLLHLSLIEICVAGQYRFHDDVEICSHFMKAEPPPLFLD